MATMELERTTTEILTGGRIHATVAAAHVQWVRDYHGDDAVKELFWRLDRNVAHELTAEGAWISFASLVALDRAIAQKFGRGRRGFLRELGRYSAHLNLFGHLRGAAVHDFFARAAVLHHRFQDFGTMLYEELGATRGRMTHTGAQCFSPVWCASATGYYEQALVMQHAIPVRVDETACRCNGAAHCTFELEWS